MQPDPVQRVYARDADFLRFASQDANYPGIVFWSQTSCSLGEVIQNLILLYEVFTAEELNGRIEYF